MSFFKAHKDTPRAANMFGSLVIVFPTAHEGGALLLRKDEKEWTFDSAKAIAEAEQPAIAYIAFYSDTEHEVTKVESGYRVTITYICTSRRTNRSRLGAQTRSPFR